MQPPIPEPRTHHASSRRRHRDRGFTLLETVVAIAVLLGALMGPVSLILRSSYAGIISKNRLIADHLAQEGIELIRAVRDNNALCIKRGASMNWNDDPDTGGGPPVLRDYYRVDALNTTTISCPGAIINTPRPVNQSVASCFATPLNLTAGGVYSYSAGTPTIFSRCVIACSPPNTGPCGSDTADSGIPPGDQMSIMSEVRWTDQSASQSVILRDRVYNWQ